jgi:hypothetical protein
LRISSVVLGAVQVDEADPGPGGLSYDPVQAAIPDGQHQDPVRAGGARVDARAKPGQLGRQVVAREVHVQAEAGPARDCLGVRLQDLLEVVGRIGQAESDLLVTHGARWMYHNGRPASNAWNASACKDARIGAAPRGDRA